jgi:hypothetical protein
MRDAPEPAHAPAPAARQRFVLSGVKEDGTSAVEEVTLTAGLWEGRDVPRLPVPSPGPPGPE